MEGPAGVSSVRPHVELSNLRLGNSIRIRNGTSSRISITCKTGYLTNGQRASKAVFLGMLHPRQIPCLRIHATYVNSRRRY